MALASAIRYAKGTCEVSTLSWNLAAINNNPFEYFLTHPDPEYAKLMADVEGFIESPGDKDAVVGSVFTQEMYGSLTASMKQCGWDCSSVEAVWSEDLAKRTIVGGFLKDKGLGAKRLMSMPDRFTNTIDLADGTIANRPTIISNYDGDMSTMAKWWDAWKSFMFENTLSVAKKGGSDSKKPYELLSPIQRAKYPALSEAEEAMCALPSAELLATCGRDSWPAPHVSWPGWLAVPLRHSTPTRAHRRHLDARRSLPLQTLCLAIFDAILLHMVSRPPSVRPAAPLPCRHLGACATRMGALLQSMLWFLHPHRTSGVALVHLTGELALARWRMAHDQAPDHRVAPPKKGRARRRHPQEQVRQDVCLLPAGNASSRPPSSRPTFCMHACLRFLHARIPSIPACTRAS